jgi:hypothetical protein
MLGVSSHVSVGWGSAYSILIQALGRALGKLRFSIGMLILHHTISSEGTQRAVISAADTSNNALKQFL